MKRKSTPQAAQSQNMVAQLRVSLCALSDYLEGYVRALKHVTVKPTTR